MLDSALPEKTWRDAGFCKLHHSTNHRSGLGGLALGGLSVGKILEHPMPSTKATIFRYWKMPVIFNTSIYVLFLHRWWGASFKRFVFLSLRSYKSRWVIFVLAASCCAATKVVPWQRSAKEIVLYHKSFNILYLFPGLSVFLMSARVFSTVRLLDDCSLL